MVGEGGEQGPPSGPAALSHPSSCISGATPGLSSTPSPSRQLLTFLYLQAPCQAMGVVGGYRGGVTTGSAHLFP